MDCKESLKEYIDKDEIYQDYKQDKLMNCSDFDKFCIQHCKDIEELLEENLELKENNMSMQEEMVRTWKKADLYKEVIEEVREYTKSHFKEMVADEEAQGLLQILDKVKEN